MMIRRNILRVIQTGCPPRIRCVIEAEAPQRAAPDGVWLGIGRSIGAALDRLQPAVAARTKDRALLIPDPRRTGEPGPLLTFAVASWLAGRRTLTIGLPSTRSDAERRRWNNLAGRAGADLALLGNAGWTRVNFGDQSLILAHADAPAELHAAATVVALCAPSGAGCLGLWSHVAHPNTALRTRFAPNAGVELAAIVNARYLLAGQIGSAWIMAWAASAITAELVARGIERLRARLNGIETPGPWEDAGVQHLSGIGQAGLSASSVVLRVRLEDNADERLARQMSEMLGWRLELESDGGSGGVGDRQR